LDFYIGDNTTFDYALQLTYELVNQLKKEVESDGAQFAVVLISPLRLVEFSQMDADEREQVSQRLPAMRRAEALTPPNQLLAEQLTANGIPVLDLRSPFLEQGEHLCFSTRTDIGTRRAINWLPRQFATG
jgi:hypothetical protein